jgi:hypothetical protein
MGNRHDLTGFSNFVEEKARWSRKTFGEEVTCEGLVAHIQKELKEVLDDPSDLEEWVDVIFLALDGASRSGHSGREVSLMILKKFSVLEKRKWENKGGHFEHERRET